MDPALRARFDLEVMPHLDMAYTLARWLLHNDHDAEDVVQESMIKALRFIADLQPGHARAWLLAIVRNTAFTWLRRHRPQDIEPLDVQDTPSQADGPDAALIRAENTQVLRSALERLSYELREAIVLREMEGLSYQAIAEVVQVPIGTVMSRLSRARARLDRTLSPLQAKDT